MSPKHTRARRVILLTPWFVAAAVVSAAAGGTLGKCPNVPFLENQGQFSERVAFRASTFGGAVFVTADGTTVYTLTAGGEPKGRGLAFAERPVGGEVGGRQRRNTTV